MLCEHREGVRVNMQTSCFRHPTTLRHTRTDCGSDQLIIIIIIIVVVVVVIIIINSRDIDMNRVTVFCPEFIA